MLLCTFVRTSGMLWLAMGCVRHSGAALHDPSTPGPVAGQEALVAIPPPIPPAQAMAELESPELELASLLSQSDARYREVEGLVRARRWAQARATLDTVAASEDGHRSDRFLAGRALSASLSGLDGDDESAHRGNTAVLAAWRALNESVARIADEAAGGDEGEKQRRFSLALSAVGQAMYAEAERDRRAAAGVAFPAYRGARTKDAVLAFINKDVAGWITKKLQAIDRAERRYRRLVDLRVVWPDSPRWVMAAAERVGTMWASVAEDLKRAPRASAWDQSPEISEAYQGRLRSACEPFTQRAQATYRLCVELSDKFRLEDEHSRMCRAKLRSSP